MIMPLCGSNGVQDDGFKSKNAVAQEQTARNQQDTNGSGESTEDRTAARLRDDRRTPRDAARRDQADRQVLGLVDHRPSGTSAEGSTGAAAWDAQRRPGRPQAAQR